MTLSENDKSFRDMVIYGIGWTRTYKNRNGESVTEYIEPERIYLTTIEFCELKEIRKNDESKRVY